MAKQNNIIFLVIGIIIVALLVNSQAPKEDIVELRIHYYDKDKNEVYYLLDIEEEIYTTTYLKLKFFIFSLFNKDSLKEIKRDNIASGGGVYPIFAIVEGGVTYSFGRYNPPLPLLAWSDEKLSAPIVETTNIPLNMYPKGSEVVRLDISWAGSPLSQDTTITFEWENIGTGKIFKTSILWDAGHTYAWAKSYIGYITGGECGINSITGNPLNCGDSNVCVDCGDQACPHQEYNSYCLPLSWFTSGGVIGEEISGPGNYKVRVFAEGLFDKTISFIVTNESDPIESIIDISYISFDIFATNTGNIPIGNIQVIDAYPQQFKDALVLAMPQFLLIGESKILWTSELMNTSQFESYTQPINFWVNISGEHSSFVDLIYKESFIGLSILPSLIVTDTITLDGNQEYSSVIVYEGGVINIGNLGWLNITTTGDIIIMGTINSKNIFSGSGNGGTGGTDEWYSGQWIELAGGGGGAGHGSNGGGGSSYSSAPGGGGGATYGSESDFSVLSGSRGGRGGGSKGGGGGSGSGWLQLTGKDISINGVLNFRGSNGGSGSTFSGLTGGGGGGGSAGTILIKGVYVNLDNSEINLYGGKGGNGGSQSAAKGGSGAGGRLKVFYEEILLKDLATINIDSGTIYYGQI